MLYLNLVIHFPNPKRLDNLTLTSVVFEYALAIAFNSFVGDLTLTSVVFESGAAAKAGATAEFNFNKCCI